MRIILCLVCWVALAAEANPVSIPEVLKPWQDWVLHDHPDAQCPYLANQPERQCLWPGKLSLNISSQGATFSMVVRVFGEADLALPSSDGAWPIAVKGNGKPLAVTNPKNKPHVRLGPGEHTVSGEIPWPAPPTKLYIPKAIGLLNLTENGQPQALPNRDVNGTLWLQKPKVTKPAEADALALKVFRKLTDGYPQTLTTAIELKVSGREREISLAGAVLPGLTPTALDSPLPARVEADGTLRLQIRPGQYTVQVDSLRREVGNQWSIAEVVSPWPAQEIWAFAAEPTLRTVTLSGAPIIDASQTALPLPWQTLPAYLLTPSDTLVLEEQYRGDPNPPANTLHLSKNLWLDFDGQQVTVEDSLTGTLHQGARITTLPPYQLGRASIDGEPQLITRLNATAQDGIEVRTRELNLNTISRFTWQSALPVSGWAETFEAVSTTLHLPPGWSALHVTGADQARGTWLSRWNLWDIFLVMMISVALWRAVSLPTGALALATLVMVYHQAGAPVWIWLTLAACMAIAPYVKGKLKPWLAGFTGASLLLALLITLPFAVQEARALIYPQLAPHGSYQAPALYDLAQEPKRAANAPAQSADAMIEEVMVSGMRASSLARKEKRFQADYDPDQKIQVGPGVPQWRWNTVTTHWSGPVLASDSTHWVLAPPWLTRMGYALRLTLVFALLSLLAHRFWQTKPFAKLPQWSQGFATLLLVGVMSMGQSPIAEAQVTIDDDLLNALEKRLLEPPTCLPHCTAIEAVQVDASETALALSMTVHSQAETGFALPGAIDQWWPTSVARDGTPASALTTQAGVLWLQIPKGIHQIQMRGSLQGLKQLDLNFHQALHNVRINAKQWRVNGLPSARQASQALTLERVESATTQAEEAAWAPTVFAPYVEVTRELHLGLEWYVQTTVRRLAPNQGAIHLNLPLLPGEAPTGGETVVNGAMEVRFSPTQNVVRWHSSLAIAESLSLNASDGPWRERWTLHARPMWHTEFEGITPMATPSITPQWAPRAGETVTLTITRPQPSEGASLAIDTAELHHALGKRASSSELHMTVRASIGQDLQLTLPDNIQLEGVSVNGGTVPMRTTENGLNIAVAPGEHQVNVRWQSPEGASLKSATQRVAFNTPASNIELTLEVPKDRWVLLLGGPALGPAILFWGVLLVVLALVVFLARTGLTPLKTYEWILLSLGVATINVWILALIAGWMVLLTLRGRVQSLPKHTAVNLGQVLLMIVSVLTLLALVSSVPASLLSNPEMYITGNHSSAYQLRWSQDQTDGALPTAWVISLPVLAYRLLMLGWSVWLAFALIRWVRWGWQQLWVGGFWVSTTEKVKVEAPDAPTSTPTE